MRIYSFNLAKLPNCIRKFFTKRLYKNDQNEEKLRQVVIGLIEQPAAKEMDMGQVQLRLRYQWSLARLKDIRNS